MAPKKGNELLLTDGKITKKKCIWHKDYAMTSVFE